jgi:hypothetical protein
MPSAAAASSTRHGRKINRSVSSRGSTNSMLGRQRTGPGVSVRNEPQLRGWSFSWRPRSLQPRPAPRSAPVGSGRVCRKNFHNTANASPFTPRFERQCSSSLPDQRPSLDQLVLVQPLGHAGKLSTGGHTVTNRSARPSGGR